MSDGSLVDMGGQKSWWWMGSLVNLARSCKLKRAMNGIFDPRLMWDGAVMVVHCPPMWQEGQCVWRGHCPHVL